MLRFLFKYAGRGGMLRVGGMLLGLAILTWLSALMSFPLRQLFYPAWRSGAHNFADTYASVLLAVLLGWIAFTWWRGHGIGRIQQFTWRRAVPLYLLPFLLIITVYALPTLIDIQSEQFLNTSRGFINKHLFWEHAHHSTWSLYPYRYWITYIIQFAYVPFIPYFKRRYTHLLALPRRT